MGKMGHDGSTFPLLFLICPFSLLCVCIVMHTCAPPPLMRLFGDVDDGIEGWRGGMDVWCHEVMYVCVL